MTIYGTGLLAACVLAGLFVGDLLGSAIGVKANVGGVGFAMILLIFSSEYLRKRGWLPQPTKDGVQFWSAIYIPVVVAMASLCIATLATNIAANVVSPANDFAHLWPRMITFRIGGYCRISNASSSPRIGTRSAQ